MRASKTAARKPGNDIHISGAEGLFDAAALAVAGTNYIARAVEHPRGMPDTIVITMEKLNARPVRALLLDIKTEDCGAPEAAWHCVVNHLSALGISERALAAASRILKSKNALRGAALLCAIKGTRLDSDRKRGVRVSRLGIESLSEKRLSKRLASGKINTATVKEALTLASKVASCRHIMAEICISDDPDYTTGYIAAKSLGYVRLPNIKRSGEMHGGRVFFVRAGADIKKTIHYLEKTAVIMEDRKG
jgi:6-carboxyhexanoate--CoA ligase